MILQPTTGHISWDNHNSKTYMNPNVHCSLIAIDKTWKQPKCSSTEKYIKVWYIRTHSHTVEYYWAIKKHEPMSFTVIWVDWEIILSEVSQRQIWHHLYVESEKWYKWTNLQNRNTQGFRKQIYDTKGERSVINIYMHTVCKSTRTY